MKDFCALSPTWDAFIKPLPKGSMQNGVLGKRF